MSLKITKPLRTGSTIGILGAGQLGRMLSLAAARLGLKCHIYAPETDQPAYDVSSAHTIAAYEDEAALRAFASQVDVITTEFENVPASTLEFLENLCPVAPRAGAVAIAQDRLSEKNFFEQAGVRTPAFAAVEDLASLKSALEKLGIPAVLKTRRMGYDGKGQAKITEPQDAEAAWQAIGARSAILEAFVPFRTEVSIIAARSTIGQVVCYDVTENTHKDHILHRSIVPATAHPQTLEKAKQAAITLAHALDYVGTFAVEFFIQGEGENETLLANEMAPRVHNSGHWTLDGCSVSQFEQHIRAISGWPLAQPVRFGTIEMLNILGRDIEDLPRFAHEVGTSVHDYGKKDAIKGRKMGHITRVKPE
jgi:5-(carboxyamino)imidazole ribonucleotide synthase